MTSRLLKYAINIIGLRTFNAGLEFRPPFFSLLDFSDDNFKQELKNKNYNSFSK